MRICPHCKRLHLLCNPRQLVRPRRRTRWDKQAALPSDRVAFGFGGRARACSTARASAIKSARSAASGERCAAARDTWLALDNCNCRSTAEAMRDELSLRRVVSIRLGGSSGGATSTVPETCRRAHCDVRIWLPRGVISGIAKRGSTAHSRSKRPRATLGTFAPFYA
jgi:hypothetical protein